MQRRRLPIFSRWIERSERETPSLFFFEEEEGEEIVVEVREGTDRVSFDRSKLARVDLFISGTYLPTTQARDTPRLYIRTADLRL